MLKHIWVSPFIAMNSAGHWPLAIANEFGVRSKLRIAWSRSINWWLHALRLPFSMARTWPCASGLIRSAHRAQRAIQLYDLVCCEQIGSFFLTGRRTKVPEESDCVFAPQSSCCPSSPLYEFWIGKKLDHKWIRLLQSSQPNLSMRFLYGVNLLNTLMNI